MNSAIANGEPEVWDDKWPQIGAGCYAKLFTRGRPTNKHQWNHRLYYHELSLVTAAMPGDPLFCELGAGRGTTAQYLTRDGADVTLVDLSEAGFELARRNFAEEGMRPPKCVLADVCETGLADESFDCVYSIGLLEHFDEPVTVLRECARLLKSGGIVFHTILDGDVIKSEGVHRTSCQAERYEAWSIEAGFKSAQCVPYRIAGVYLLVGEK